MAKKPNPGKAVMSAVRVGTAQALAQAIEGLAAADRRKAVNFQDDEGERPLGKAIRYGHGHLLAPLIEAGAKAKNKRDTFESALTRVAGKADTDLMAELLRLIPGNQWSKPEVIEALGEAADQNCTAVMDMLPEVDAAELTDIAGIAAMMGHASALKWCLDRGVDPNTRKDEEDDTSETLLHRAVGKPGTTALLIDRGAELNARDHRERTALMRAVGSEVEAVTERISSMEKMNLARENRQVIFESAPQEPSPEGRPDTSIGLLLEAGADATLTDRDGLDALAILQMTFPKAFGLEQEEDADAINVVAAEATAMIPREAARDVWREDGPDDAFKILWAHEEKASMRLATVFAAALRRAGAKGQSDEDRAVAEAVQKEDPEALKRALEAGGSVYAKIRVQNGYAARTPLSWSALKGDIACCEVLLDAGADPDDGGSAGTPLFGAVRKGSGPVAKLLIERGADPNKSEYGGTIDTFTPLEMAKLNRRTEVVAVLEAIGSKAPEANEPFKPSGEISDTHTELLVKADAEKVIQTIEAHLGMTAHRNAHNKTIDAAQTRGYIVVQLDGSEWTSIVPHVGCDRIPDDNWYDLAKAASAVAMSLLVTYEDCSGQTAYWLYEQAEEIEVFIEAFDDPEFGSPGKFESKRGRRKPRNMARGNLVLNKLAKDERFCIFYAHPGGSPGQPFELSFIGDRRKLKAVAYVGD